jgi:hypothetical protein
MVAAVVKKVHTYLGLLNLSFLLIFGLTGVHLALHRPGGHLLWFKQHKEPRIGLVLLAASLGFSVTVMVLLGTA